MEKKTDVCRIGTFGEKSKWGKFPQRNRVYDSNSISPTLVKGMDGCMILVKVEDGKEE